MELLLPSGFAETALVLGDACPAALAPSAPEPGSDETAVDLIIVAPSKAQEQDPSWVEETVRRTALRLAAAGIAYVVPASARAVSRALQLRELRRHEMLLHVPDTARSHHVVPLGTAAARYALSGQLRMKSSKRLAARTLLRSPALAARAPTGLVFRRRTAAPLASWLFDPDPPPVKASALVSRRSDDAGAVLLRFPGGESQPDAVAKVSPQGCQELEALRMLAPAAARAGVRVPDVLSSGFLGTVPVVLESAVAGEIAARQLEQKRLAPAELHERLAEWILQWGRFTRRERPIRSDDLERLVLAPGAELLPDQPQYRDRLSALCDEVAGSRCPFVASHGDLTASNIVIDEAAGLGVLDWEKASKESLPLMDFFYAAADAVAAVGGYADRPGSVVDCFAREGQHTEHVAGLIRRLSLALDVSPTVQELCFHACWLHHAGNETERTARGPFLAIIEMVAREHGRFWRHGNLGTPRQ
jgi:hypothetical protein